MERSVRYIFRDGYKAALCFRGRTKAHCIINDETTVRAIEIPIRDHDTSSLVRRHGEEYPASIYAANIRKVGMRKGITRRALALLDLPTTAEEPTELPPDDSTAGITMIPDGNPAPVAAECASPAARPAEPRDITTTASGRNGSSGTQLEAAPVRRSSDPAKPQVARRTGAKPVASLAEARRLSTASPRPADSPRKAPAADRRPPKGPDRGRQASDPRGNATKTTLAVDARQQERGALIARIAAELKITGQQLRVKLRAAGMHAPYTNEQKIREAIAGTGK